MSKWILIIIFVLILVLVLPALLIGMLNRLDAFLYLSLSIMFKMIGMIFTFGMLLAAIIIAIVLVKKVTGRK